MIAALLAFWPRGPRAAVRCRVTAATRSWRSPRCSSRRLARWSRSAGRARCCSGSALAALTVCFLWLERLPLRPGLGVAALIGLALAGALPLAAAADRGEPWFDYQSFAEGLGPKDPVRFDWGHGDYGPITWPRNGAEVVRVKAGAPPTGRSARSTSSTAAAGTRGGASTGAATTATLDLPAGLGDRPALPGPIQVSVQRHARSPTSSAPARRGRRRRDSRGSSPASAPGQWESVGDLRRGDSYTRRGLRPAARRRSSSPRSSRADDRAEDDERVRHRADSAPGEAPADAAVGRRRQPDPTTRAAEVHVRSAVGRAAAPLRRLPPATASERRRRRPRCERSDLARTWALSQRLKRGTDDAVRVRARGQTTTCAAASPTPRSRRRRRRACAPLESFLFDTKAGYCQHYSAAMALLLRMGGIPARVATGFSPGGYSKRKQAWIVRDTDAHSWVEAWFDALRLGDHRPDAVRHPGALADRRARAAAGATRRRRRGPRTPAPATPRGRQRAPARSAFRPELRRRRRDAERRRRRRAAAGLAVGRWPCSRCCCARARPCALFAAARAAPTPLERAISELETALRRSGRPRPTGMTLRQLERRLGALGRGGRLPARGQRRPLRAAPGAADRRAAPRAAARARPAASGSPAGCATFWALPPRRARRSRLRPDARARDHPVRVGDLEVALAPRLGLDRRRDLDARDEPRVSASTSSTTKATSRPSARWPASAAA